MQEEGQETSAGAAYRERYGGSRYLRFSLPKEVDDTRTEAKYQDGVPSLTQPKKPGTARKPITVQ